MSDTRYALDRFAVIHHKEQGDYPLILGVECYEHFGQRCAIVSSDEIAGGSFKGIEVVIENSYMTRAVVDFDDLSWAYGPEMLRRVRATGQSPEAIAASQPA